MRINSRPWRLAAFGALVLGTSPAAAADSTQRQHGAHVHGEGLLQVAVDGAELFIALRMPAVNVVGFEHAPASDEQRSRVAAAEKRFGDGARLLMPDTAAGCTLVSSEARLGAAEHDEHHAHEKKSGHDEHQAHETRDQHDEHHAHAKKDGHDGSAPGSADEETHTELHAEYRFLCKSPAALTAIDVRLFDALMGTRSLEAQVVTPGYQRAIELTPARSRLPLTR